PASAAIGGRAAVATQLLVATLSGCVVMAVPFFCLGGGAGRLASETEGLARPATDSTALFVGLARAGIRIPVAPRLALEPFAEGFVHASRHRIAVDDRIAHRL